ncbi:MAG: autoinducer binding domain-containing protein [Burkholderiaceae bacterium]|nr:autoinducer binding domain-containing protein [Burkholderiaceae bacterium]
MSRIPQALGEAAALELLSEGAKRLGAEVAAFVSFVRDDGSHESYRFLLACDPVWCHEYERHAWYANDPWLAYCLGHSEPILASEIPLGNKSQRAVADLASRFGFTSAVVVPAPSSGGLSRVGVLCLGSPMPGYFESDGFMAVKIASRSLAMELHEWWIGRIKRELIANAGITEDDLALLRHERLGHSTKAIALELATSASAIDSRFKRINQKLGVPNRKAAANLAAEYGLI